MIKQAEGNRPISRMSGAKNTFFVVNSFDPQWSSEFKNMADSDKREMAKHLCQSFFGFYTDGILFIKPEMNFDFSWDFYNSDGSTAEMCGNAARCAALFFYSRVEVKKNLKFLTSAGTIVAEVLSNQLVRIQMTEILSTREQTVSGHKGIFVNTGVPHFVLEMSPSRDLAKALRKVSDFGAAGANITFVEQAKEAHIKAVSFERGVEDFTEACGTGAVAAAVYLQKKLGKQKFVQVEMPGGNLQVENLIENQRPFLTGQAQLEFDLIHWEKK